MKERPQERGPRFAQGQHVLVEMEQAASIAQLRDMGSAARHRDVFHTLRHHPPAGISVGRSAGDRENAEAIDLQMIRQRTQQRRPIDQPPALLEIRVANARSIGRDDAHTEIARRIMSQLGHGPRAGPAMTKENRNAPRVAVFAEREGCAVLQLYDFLPNIHGRDVICTGSRQTEDCL
jgi:hypothetical protein